MPSKLDDVFAMRRDMKVATCNMLVGHDHLHEVCDGIESQRCLSVAASLDEAPVRFPLSLIEGLELVFIEDGPIVGNVDTVMIRLGALNQFQVK